MKTIALLGGHGYIGSAIASEIERRNWKLIHIPFKTWFHELENVEVFPDLIINCAAFIPPESVDRCDNNPAQTINGNVVLPALLAQYCESHKCQLAHVSTASLWDDGQPHAEDDFPTRAFDGVGGFYIGTKIMSEHYTQDCRDHYIWRLQLPFDNQHGQRNSLSRLVKCEEVSGGSNTVVNRHDFAIACMDLVATEAPFGTYNVMNPGAVKAVDVCQALVDAGIRKGMPAVVIADGGSVADCSKLLAAGVIMPTGIDAVKAAIATWNK